MKGIRRIISGCLVICMLITMPPMQVFANSDEMELQASENPCGPCGDELTWEFDADNSTLTISGIGDMWEFSSEENDIICPWAEYAQQIETVVVEEEVTSICESAFYHAASLTSVMLEEGLERIGDGAFLGCYALSEIIIPESVTYIGEEAFYDCIALENINIPASVTYIGENAFEFCWELSGIWVDEGNTNYSSDKFGVLFSKDKTTLIKAPGGLTGAYEIPATVTDMGLYAFEECSVESIVIPGSLTAIGDHMFAHCENLTKVILQEGVEEIGDNVFSKCGNLKEISIPKSVKTIGDIAFNKCENLSDVYYSGTEEVWQAVTIGENNDCLIKARIHFAEVEEHEHIFGDWYETKAPTQEAEGEERRDCSSCDEYETRPIEKLPEVAEENRGSCGKNLTWKFDEDTGTLTISGTGEMDDYFEDLSMIPWRKFYDGITKIVIGDGVTTIGTYAFYECTELQEISISDSVTTINISIYTKNLDKLVIPAGVTELHLAFEENDVKFIEVVPENKAYSSDEYGVLFNKNKTVLECYPGGSSVSAYTVPEGVTEIKDWAFRGCRNIEKVTLSESLEKLCNLAFCYSGLQEIHFQGEAPEFGYDVFAYLTADVYYPKNDESWTETVRQNYGGTINWVAVGGELDIKEQLRQLVETKDEMTLEEIRAAVQSLEFDELLTAMRNDEEVINYLMLLGGSSGITITKDVPIWNKTFHTAVGLSLNNIQSDDPVRLDKPVAAVDIPDGYESDNAIHFSINLDSLGDDRTLAVPVCIDLISPDEIHPNFQHVFWRNPETNAVEEIPVVARWNKVGWSVQFVISSEGDYVMAAPENAVMSGKCGGNLTWRYDDTYTLTISGSGEMYDYDLDTNKTPWYSVRENVKHIEIGENVTGIGAYAFYDCRFADKTVIPASAKSVGEYAFYGMDEQVFYFEGDAPEIAETAFYYAEYSTIYYHANKQGWSEIISKVFVEADGLEWVPMKEGSDSCGENLTWEFDAATGKLTISGTGEMINTWWPYEMKDKLPQFAPWHDHAIDIKSVVINSGVTSIGHFAFFDCVNLTSVSIPEGVTFVGCAFVGCDSLKELYIPASVTDFRYPTNEGICNGLEKIVVSEENTVYSSDEAGMLYNKERTKLIGCPTAFQGSCAIPNGVTTIGDWAFYACDGLTSVGIPASIATIGMAAFSGCEKLDSVVIPAGVTTIPMWAFFGCTELSEITIPTSVTKIGSSALAECESLEAMYFEGDAPEIEYDCFNLTAATAYYPANNDTWTEDVREDYCGKIEWVEYIPNENRCGDELFWEFDAGTKTLTIFGKGNMYDFPDAGSPWYSLNTEIDHVVIREGVTSIGNYAFVSCGMDDIEIPDSVTRIGQGAFALSRVESIRIPAGVAKIEDYAFTRSALNSVVLPEQLKMIGENAFAETELAVIALPNSLQEIGAEAFWGTLLTSVIIPENVSVIGAGAFAWCKELASISVAENNTNFAVKKDVLFDKSGIKLIQYPVKKALETYTVPEGTTVIGAFAFSGAKALKGIALPNSVTSFEECAFIGCSGLTEIKIPKKVASFALGVFHTCHGLKSITFTGNAPDFAGDWIDEDMVLTAYYPKGDNTWTANKRLNYGGKITWVLFCDHSFGNWYQTKVPTEEAEGEERRNCEKCEYYETRSVEKLPHEHEYTSKVTAPTCTEQGYTTYSCRCSDSYVDNYVSALDHSWGSWWEKTAPTCTKEGINQRDCQRSGCDAAETENIDSLGHNYGEWYETKAPTVDEEGEERRDCVRGDHYETRPIGKLPVDDDIVSGTCGEKLTWTLDNEGALVISGTGDMTDYTTNNKAPWYTYRTSITSLVINHGVISIGDYAFIECEYIVDVSIPSSIGHVGGAAFYGCNSLSEVHICDLSSWCAINFESSSSNPASYAGGLVLNSSPVAELVIPDSVISIKKYAFYGCDELIGLLISDNVESIGANAFYDCVGLENVAIGNGVTSIGTSAFGNCISLNNMVIPEGVTDIGSSAFSGCTELVSVTIPKSVANIGNSAFSGCEHLREVRISDLKAWCDINFGSSASNPTYYAQKLTLNGKELTELVIPDGVEYIGDYAFYQCTGLTSITIPNCVVGIGEYSFCGNESLSNIVIPDSVTSIGFSAFQGCKNLSNVVISENVSSIPTLAFSRCTSLEKVTIPDSIISIGMDAFSFCTDLKYVIIPSSVVGIYYHAFDSCENLSDIYYSGSEAQWNAISGLENNDFSNVEIHYNSTGPNNPTLPLSGWQKAYYDFIVQNKENYEKHAEYKDWNDGVRYELLYIDNDDIPELFISYDEGCYYGGYGFIFAQYKEGKIECFAESFGVATIEYLNKGGIYALSYSHNGYWFETVVSLENKESSTLGYSSNMDSDGNLGSTFEWNGISVTEAKYNEKRNEVLNPAEITTTLSDNSKIYNYNGILEYLRQDSNDDMDNAYRAVLNEYRAICSMTRDEYDSQYKESDYPYVNQLMMRYYHIYGGMQIVYVLYDIDGNGVNELLIGNGNVDKASIIGLYAFDGEKAVTLNNTAGERQSVKVHTDGTIKIQNSESASSTSTKYYRLDASGSKLTEVSAGSLVEIQNFEWKMFDTFDDTDEHPDGGFNESIYRVNYLLDKERTNNLQYYLEYISEHSPTKIILEVKDNTGDDIKSIVELWRTVTLIFDAATLDGSSITEYGFELVHVNEAILLNALGTAVDSDDFILPTMKKVSKNSKKLLKALQTALKEKENWEISETAELISLSDEQKATVKKNLKAVIKESELSSQLGTLTDTVEMLDDIMDVCLTLEELITKTYEYALLWQLPESMASVLDEMYKQTPNDVDHIDMREALKFCRDSILETSAELFASKVMLRSGFMSGGKYFLKEGVSFMCKSIKETAIKAVPGLNVLLVGYKAGRTISNMFFKTDSIAEQVLKLCVVNEYYNSLYNAIPALTDKYNSNQTIENADMILNALSLLFALADTDCGVANSYVAVVDEALWTKISEAFGKKSYNSEGTKRYITNMQSTFKQQGRNAATYWVFQLKADYPDIYPDYADLVSENSSDNVLVVPITSSYLIECPVNVYVYNMNGDLLASLCEDNTYSLGDVSAIQIENRKFIDIYNNTKYQIKCEGYDQGTMDVTIEERNGLDVIRNAAFYDLPVTNSIVYELITKTDPTDNIIHTITSNNESISADFDSNIKTDTDVHIHSGGIATCTKKAVCAVCGVSYGNLADHDYETNWSQGDANGHWHECKNCSAHDTQVKHMPGAATESTAQVCTDCGYVITPATGHITHTAGNQWVANNEAHWHKCTGCNEKLDVTAHTGGTATCMEKAVCEVCGRSYGEKNPRNHSFTKYHSDHNATCKKNGTKTAKCDYGCGETDTVTDRGSKLGHQFDGNQCVRCGLNRWNPDTGDKIMIAVAVLVISGAALLILVSRKKRK